MPRWYLSIHSIHPRQALGTSGDSRRVQRLGWLTKHFAVRVSVQLAVLLAVSLGVLTSTAFVAGAASNGKLVALTGRVLIAHGDAGHGTPGIPEQTWLAGLGHPILVTGLNERLAGQSVTVTGHLAGGVLTADSAQFAAPTLQTGPISGFGVTATGMVTAAAYGARTVHTAYLLARFASDPASPYSVTSAQATVFGATNSVAAFYRDSSDSGIILTGDILGWYTVPATSGCDWQSWSANAQAAASAAGIDMSQYQEVVVGGPYRSSCAFAGIGYVGVSGAYINGSPSIYVVGHEIGHNFGSHHASTLRCTSGGSVVSLSASCSSDEYGDPFSIMGGGPRLHDAQQAYQIAQHMNGGVPDGAIVTATSGAYTLARRHSGANPQLLRIARGTTGTSFDVEMRAPYGAYDSFATGSSPVSGVLIRVSPTNLTTVSQSQLLDATPTTNTFSDASFVAGASLTDPVSGVRITVTSVGSAAASITVSPGADVTAPSAPGSLTGSAALTSVTLKWSAASDNVGVTGYQVRKDAQLLGTTTATNYTVTRLVPGITSTYTIQARDRAGNLGPASTLVLTTVSDVTAPSGVGLIYTKPAAGGVGLGWTLAKDNVGVVGYQVYVGGSLFQTVKSGSATVTGMVPASTYTIAVRAIDAAGNLGPASGVTVTTKGYVSNPRLGTLNTVRASDT